MTTLIRSGALFTGSGTLTATRLRKAFWLLVLLVAVAYSTAGTMTDSQEIRGTVERLSYVYFNVGSFALGVLFGMVIFLRKPDSLMALATSIMLITFTATDTGFRFWYPLLQSLFSPWTSYAPVAYAAALFLDVLFMALFTSSLTYVLLTFPHESLPSGKVRWFFNLLIASQAVLLFLIGMVCLLDVVLRWQGDLAYVVYLILNMVKSVLLIGLAILQLNRLQKITEAVDRQKVRWIAVSLTGMTVFYAIGMLYSSWYGTRVPLWAFIPNLIFTYGFIITLFFAIRRYRLWDIGFFYNKALVYSLVTAVLSVVAIASALVTELLAGDVIKNSPFFAVLVVMLMAVLVGPVREKIQALVDHHLKPEEVDFGSALVEIGPDAGLSLSSQEILGLLARQMAEQLDLTSAAICLEQEGQLTQCELQPADAQAPRADFDDQALARLRRGEVIILPEGSPSSLYIPLVVKRAARPEFRGVLVFGPRKSGEGYPTHVLKSLKKLGCDAGKAIYLAQLRERLGQNVLERLAAIERGLSNLQKPAGA